MSFSLDAIFCFVYTLSGLFKYHITVANISAHDKTQCMVKSVVARPGFSVTMVTIFKHEM